MKNRNTLLRTLVLFPVLACLLSACTEGYKPHLIGVKIEPGTLTLMTGDTETLKAVILPARLTFETIPVWELLDENNEVITDSEFITVSVTEDNNLEVTAVKPGGKAIVRVTIDEVYYAICEVKVVENFTVYFESNGGTAVDPVKTERGASITEPAPPPTRDGYVFGGWYKDTGLTERWNFGNDIVTTDVTLYARWLPSGTVPFTVTFESNGGSEVAPIMYLMSGDKISQPAIPTKTGRYSIFGGWYTDAALNEDSRYIFGTEVTADITLYAKWLLYNTTTYTAKFDTGTGGSPVANVTGLVEGSTIPRPTDPTRDGYIFESWHTVAPKKPSNGQPEGANLNDTNKWDFDTGTITVTKGEGEEKIIGNINDDGYLTLYAKWFKPTTYIVTFRPDGGTPAPTQQTIATDGKVTEPPAMTKAGYTFVGWYKEPAFTNLWDFATDTVTANITLYAKWNLAGTPGISLNKTTLTLTVGGSETLTVTPTNVTPTSTAWASGDTAVATVSTTGVVTAVSAGTAVITATVQPGNLTATCTVTVNAAGTFTVTFDSNGGSAVAPITGLASGSTITEPTAPTKSGNTFDGWYKEAAFTNQWNFATDTVTGNITLYAKWTATTPVVFWQPTFTGLTIDAGGEYVGNTGIQAADKANTTLTVVADGFTFSSAGQYKPINIQTGTAVGGTEYYFSDGFNAAADTSYTISFMASVDSTTANGQIRFKANGGSFDSGTAINSTPKLLTYSWTQTSTGGNFQFDSGNTTGGFEITITDIKITSP